MNNQNEQLNNTVEELREKISAEVYQACTSRTIQAGSDGRLQICDDVEDTIDEIIQAVEARERENVFSKLAHIVAKIGFVSVMMESHPEGEYVDTIQEIYEELTQFVQSTSSKEGK